MLLVGELDGSDWTTAYVTSGELDPNRNPKWSIEGSGFLSSHFKYEHQSVKVLLRPDQELTMERDIEKEKEKWTRRAQNPWL